MKPKVLLSIFCVFFTAVALHAQTGSMSLDEAEKVLAPLKEEYQAARNAKNWPLAISKIDEINKGLLAIQLTEADKEQLGLLIKQAVANNYYNQACYYSLMHKKKEAFSALQKALDYGYKKYRQTINDSDFDNIRGDKRFLKILEPIRKYDNLYILKNSGKYTDEPTDSLPPFRYQSADNTFLKHTREFFKLDSVAGTGDEVSQMINILKFVHDNIAHDGNHNAVCERDALDIYYYYKATGRGVNCRLLAIVLNEMYLSMGWPSRYVTCMPQDPNDPDCHVINAVYSKQLGKWLWMDPTFEAYVMDEKGNLLSVQEVRERLISGLPLVLNEDANWNHKNKQTKEQYLDNYMAKNLYYLDCVDNNCFNPEPRYRNVKRNYIALIPEGFTSPNFDNSANRVTSNDKAFWAKPAEQEKK